MMKIIPDNILIISTCCVMILFVYKIYVQEGY